jgi:TolB-like protein
VVVPFDNETGSPELDRVAKGVSDATVAQLATPDRLRQLRVIGNASGLKLSFARRDLKAMGDSLGAQYLVLGQMKRDDRRFRIVAHLIRVSDQTHVWATTFDRDGLDLPTQSALAEEIAKAVVARIRSS